jgi:hypothetical protein
MTGALPFGVIQSPFFVILSGAKDLSPGVVRFAKDPSGFALRMTTAGGLS